MDQLNSTHRLKTESEFFRATAISAVGYTLAALVISVGVTWLTTLPHSAEIRNQAVFTATILPLIIAPTCMFFFSRQNLRNHRLMVKITHLANTDEMTGLANRRAFMREAAKHLNATDLSTQGLCMFLIDLDHFKAVNDRYGHSAGDHTLIHVTSRMTSALPDGALIARLGGEEFAVFLPFDEFADIHQQAETLREAVASAPCRVEAHVINVTISVGIGIAGVDDTVSSVLSRADCALYEAKNAGRNRFSIAA